MKVYRLCRIDEVQSILMSESFKNVGKRYKEDSIKNNHKYENNRNYMHFFADKSSLLYFNMEQGGFICVYDIPDDILKENYGKGYYLSFDNLKNTEEVSEYAIKSEKIKFEYVKSIFYIKEYIDVENYIEDDSLSNFIVKIYNKDNMQLKQNGSIIKLENILTGDDVVKSINYNLDYLISIIPEIKDMIGFEHKHPHHHLDVWNHTLLALSLSQNIFEVRLALLLHDIGKPHCFTEGKVRHFKGHPEVSSIIGKNILLRLGYNDDFISEICYLIKFHDTPIVQEDIDNNYELSYKRFLIQKCDAFAHNPKKIEKRKNYIEKTANELRKSLLLIK